MRNRNKILKNGYDASRVDFVGAFIRLWVSYNTWYNDQFSRPTKHTEIDRILKSARREKVHDSFWSSMNELNDPTHNDNALHILQTVENLSVFEYPDGQGNTNHHSSDITGFKYRLRCNRKNVHTDFLHMCCRDRNLRDWCHGILSFNTSSRNDDLFSVLYGSYHRDRHDNIHQQFDAIKHIPEALKNLGIDQYGCLLFHNLENSSPSSNSFIDIRDIFDSNFFRLKVTAKDFDSKTKVKKSTRELAQMGEIIDGSKRVEGPYSKENYCFYINFVHP